jgi:hypothetical protein
VLTVIIAREHGLIDRHDKYRPRISPYESGVSTSFSPVMIAAVDAGDVFAT